MSPRELYNTLDEESKMELLALIAEDIKEENIDLFDLDVKAQLTLFEQLVNNGDFDIALDSGTQIFEMVEVLESGDGHEAILSTGEPDEDLDSLYTTIVSAEAHGFVGEKEAKHIHCSDHSELMTLARTIPQIGSSILLDAGARVFMGTDFMADFFQWVEKSAEGKKPQRKKFKDGELLVTVPILLKVVNVVYEIFEGDRTSCKVELSPMKEMNILYLQDDAGKDIQFKLCNCQDPSSHDPLHIKERTN